MADTLKYNEPSVGPAVATDDVSGVHFQRVKLDVGGNGLTAPLVPWSAVTDGYAGADVLPSSLAYMNGVGTLDRSRNWIGTHANAWSAAAVAVGGLSNAVEVSFGRTVSIFGTSSAIGGLFVVQFSQNGTTFYDTLISSARDSAGNHAITFDCGARFVRLKATQSSGTITYTMTIAAKGI